MVEVGLYSPFVDLDKTSRFGGNQLVACLLCLRLLVNHGFAMLMCLG